MYIYEKLNPFFIIIYLNNGLVREELEYRIDKESSKNLLQECLSYCIFCFFFSVLTPDQKNNNTMVQSQNLSKIYCYMLPREGNVLNARKQQLYWIGNVIYFGTIAKTICCVLLLFDSKNDK